MTIDLPSRRSAHQRTLSEHSVNETQMSRIEADGGLENLVRLHTSGNYGFEPSVNESVSGVENLNEQFQDKDKIEASEKKKRLNTPSDQ